MSVHNALVRDLLRSLWLEPRPADVPRRVWYDWAFVAAVAPIAVAEGFVRQDLPLPVLSVVVTVGILPTVLWRRTRPLLMVAIAFGVCGLVTAVTGGASPRDDALVYLVVLPYSLYRWGSGRDVVIGSGIMLAKMLAGLALGDTSWTEGIAGTGVLLAAAALGTAFRYRSVARSRSLDKVKLLERERLARDLHDTVAHHVSAIAIRAQAGLAVAEAQPAAAADALRVIEAEASRALAEMRAMVRVLRQGEPAEPVEAAYSARISDLERLAGRARAGGPAVEIEVTGNVDDLPPAVGSAVYRLAQESITNARRHARHATRILVRVAADDTSVHLRVSDDGEGGHARPARPEHGFGLIGMAERAGLLGGTVQAGPDPGRGWTVTAVLPRGGAPA